MKIIKTLGFEDESFHFEDIQSFMTCNGNYIVFNSSPNPIFKSMDSHWIYICTESEPIELSFDVIPYKEADNLNKLNKWLEKNFEDSLCEAYEHVPTINCADE